MYTLNMRKDLRDILDEPRSVCFSLSYLDLLLAWYCQVGTFSVPFTTTTRLSKDIPVEATVHGRSSFSLVTRKDIESGLTSSDGKQRELELSVA